MTADSTNTAPLDSDAVAAARRRGMVLTLLGTALLSTSDALSKTLTETYPVGELIFLRGLCVLIPVLLIVRAQGGIASLRVADWRAQLVRGTLFVMSGVFFVTSLSLLPLPLVTTVSFVAPIFTTLLAIPLLGERVSWPVWVAVFAGFGGVVVTLDPSGAPWSWAALLPVLGALAASLRDILTRRLSARETSGAIMFYSMALMVACASLSAPFGWRWPDPLDLLLFLAVGFLVGGAHTLMIEGIRLCEVSLIAPLKYVMILYSIGYGALIWHDLPSLQALLGTVIIVASGVFIVRRQARA
ncbi:MAG: DMT family transporter [Alphaproteobacteria bacterium]|nr:DMT family transporter [Alphaproteobacteria bacterium]